MKSMLTTLCYIEKEDSYLMLHRISKKNDVNKEKWIGVGGHFEKDESPEDCLLREVTFILKDKGSELTEYMCLYTADDYEGTLCDCNEGVLKWVDKNEIFNLNLWEGDRIFLRLLQENHPFFSLKLVYEGNCLKEAVLDGKRI